MASKWSGSSWEETVEQFCVFSPVRRVCRQDLSSHSVAGRDYVNEGRKVEGRSESFLKARCVVGICTPLPPHGSNTRPPKDTFSKLSRWVASLSYSMSRSMTAISQLDPTTDQGFQPASNKNPTIQTPAQCLTRFCDDDDNDDDEWQPQQQWCLYRVICGLVANCPEQQLQGS